MGVSMIGGSNLIPYGILFGGHKFMLFSLFRNAHTLGQVRYGLACSDIINCTDIATPLIPLIIFTLLGNTNDLQLYQPTFTIPPIPSPVIQDSNPVTQSRLCQQSLYVFLGFREEKLNSFLFQEKGQGHLPYPYSRWHYIQVVSALP